MEIKTFKAYMFIAITKKVPDGYKISFDKEKGYVLRLKRPYEPHEHPNEHSDTRMPASPLTDEQLHSLNKADNISQYI